MATKVHKVELVIVDFDDLGSDEVRLVIENARYPNHCISPNVIDIHTREVEWSDDHPLNHSNTFDAALKELFS